MNKDNINEFASFDEYLRQGEPLQKERAENWKTAIGLQAVDGLQPSAYLIDVAKRNIEGEITLDETRKLIDSYYQSKTVRTPKDEDEEEADKVSATSRRFSPARPLLQYQRICFPAPKNIRGSIQARRRNPPIRHFQERMGARRRFRKLPELGRLAKSLGLGY